MAKPKLKHARKLVSKLPFEDNLYLGELRYGKVIRKLTIDRHGDRARPTDPGILDKICAGLISGKSLDAICTADPAMPYAREVYLEIAKDPESAFAKSYYYAKQLQQDALIDETLSLADQATEENYNSLRLKIQTRQVHAKMVAPKKYGDKLDGQVAVQVVNINVTPDEYAQVSRRIDEDY